MSNKKIPLFIVGMLDDESSGLIVSKFNDTFVRLQKVYTTIVEARVTIEMSRVKGKKKYFEVRTVVVTPRKTHVYKEKGWELSNVCENLGQRLLRNLSKRKKNRVKGSIRKIEGKMF